jgi:hypothetical protein
LVNFNSLDYKRPEEQHGILLDINRYLLSTATSQRASRRELILWTVKGQKNNMECYEISPLVNFNITESFQVRVNSLD